MAKKVVVKVRIAKSKPAAKKVVKKALKKGMKEEKIAKVMREYKRGSLHSGSKKGPKVTKRKQAVAIALSEARKAGKAAIVKVKRKK